MGLAISVGFLSDLETNDAEGAAWFQESLEVLNKVLLENGLKTHLEPRFSEPIPTRAASFSFPYSFLHYLRRALAHARRDPLWRAEPLLEGQEPTDDPVLEDELFMFNSHLLNHSDAEGYYVPQDFEDVIYDESNSVPGQMIGSSQRLLLELVQVSAALEIRLDNGELSASEVQRIVDVVHADTGLHREHCAWFALYEAARASIQLNTLIVFS